MSPAMPTDAIATVFGGSGFVGRYVVRELARAGWRVRVACRRPDRALFVRPMGVVGQVTPVWADVRDDVSTGAALRDAAVAVSLVGILAEAGPQRFEALHHEGAGRIARLAAAGGCRRLVHVSAIGASASSPSAYGRSKAAGEAAVRQAFPEAVILRPSLIFGPEDGSFNLFAALARLLPVLPLFGGGGTRFQPVWVGDVAAAVMAAVARPELAGRTIELGGPRIYTYAELMELVLKTVGRRRPLVSVPWSIARIQAAVLSVLPGRLLTPDQLRQLAVDNVVAEGATTLADLGISPTPAEAVLPTYLDRFRPGGQFARRRPAG
jgi:NADH dehydrogenase